MLTEAVYSFCAADTSFEGFAETARSFMESIAGLETLTEPEASSLVNQLWRDYMAKKPSKSKQPEKKQKKEEAPKPAEAPAEKPPETKAEPMKIDLDRPAVKKAIEGGQVLLKAGKTKAEAAWTIYQKLMDEDKDLIVAAFVKGASLTEKGALTYWYNCKRKAAKEAPAK
jgi:hypothetical protein